MEPDGAREFGAVRCSVTERRDESCEWDVTMGLFRGLCVMKGAGGVYIYHL